MVEYWGSPSRATVDKSPTKNGRVFKRVKQKPTSAFAGHMSPYAKKMISTTYFCYFPFKYNLKFVAINVALTLL